MATSTLLLGVLQATLCLAAGQTIVCNVKDCYQTSGGVDDQLVKGSVVALQAQVQQLMSDVRELRADNSKLQQALATRNASSGVNLKQCSKQQIERRQ
ncbi:hypothetical protein LSAT2_029529 [Lamellibrachia satsuma]|nr:hypothetical protein LSAT2_029529 [Lamellibrachia satsuma]